MSNMHNHGAGAKTHEAATHTHNAGGAQHHHDMGYHEAGDRHNFLDGTNPSKNAVDGASAIVSKK